MMLTSPARGRGAGRATLTLEVEQQQPVAKSRPCRVQIGVDVSGSMLRLIGPVIRGIKELNSVLDEEDLVSVVDFAESIRTVFPYLQRSHVDWVRLGSTLRSHVEQSNRGMATALWDAIGYMIETTPRNTQYHRFKPELIIFTDGKDNCSEKHTRRSIQEKLGHPGIPHAHITIIDASAGGNSQLRAICDPIDHCSYVQVHASQEAIQRAFVDVRTAITQRLTLTIESDNITDTLASQLGQLNLLSGPLGPQTHAGDSGRRVKELKGVEHKSKGSQGDKKSARGRGRGSAQRHGNGRGRGSGPGKGRGRGQSS